MRLRTDSLFSRNILPKSAVCNKTIVSATIFFVCVCVFSGFVLPLMESRLMPGATSNPSVLSICSLDYT